MKLCIGFGGVLRWGFPVRKQQLRQVFLRLLPDARVSLKDVANEMAVSYTHLTLPTIYSV